ncbi:MAG: hypothetical protein UT84_C0003G0074 [Candidatus Curtissbacteria bacterium GW2011_GWA1_40_16]|uniref:Uncharacterized protein n=1 Tax=Candidatus Curtissbacteria bacterium GW2011_GWA1_40_16 TaxID=1618405 RepID=A0A0G0REE0_9BACT|nr:MAG: hypothetical protein UT84_C0003G0074 [Candidatus Curtissbacteria bacterium GW2011_GWA1_40_16]
MDYLIFGSITTLLWLGFWGLVVYIVWVFVRNSIPALKGIGPDDLSPLSLILTVFLVLAVLFLFEQAWNDLGNLAGGNKYVYDATVELSRLLIRTVFVGPATFIALLLYFSLKGKGTRYGVITLPYFITSLIFLIRLLFDAGRFVLSEYRVIGIYIVLVFIIIVISGLIFFIQKQYEEYKKQESKVQKGLDDDQSKQKINQSLPQV